jgi:uncharacterized protein YrzB (UPF0473 family)
VLNILTKRSKNCKIITVKKANPNFLKTGGSGMANEYTPDLITLIGDDGKEIEFEILDIIENDEGKFYVLYPFFENPEDAVNDSGEYYIFEVTEIDGEEELAEIEDDDKLNRIAAVFEERYNEEFYDEDD